MKTKTKKLIAREGLILLLLATFGGVALFCWLNITEPQIEVYKIELEDGRRYEIPAFNEDDLQARMDYLDKENPSLSIAQEEINLLFKADFEKYSNKKNIKYFNTVMGWVALISLVLFYPLYWLVRFTIWAIKTLRQKE